jgi:hypothetical protein
MLLALGAGDGAANYSGLSTVFVIVSGKMTMEPYYTVI